MNRAIFVVCLWAFLSAYIAAYICKAMGARGRKGFEFFVLLSFVALIVAVMVGYIERANEPYQGFGGSSIIEH